MQPASISFPLRRDRSVRRTSSIDETWPAGGDEPARYDCTGRDTFTRCGASAPWALDAAQAVALCRGRTILAVRATPSPPGLDRLKGAVAGGKMRGLLGEVMPDRRDRGDLLHLLLDDLAGATLVSRWGWTRWLGPEARREDDARTAALAATMLGVCHGFRPGSSAMVPNANAGERLPGRMAPPLCHPADPSGWHGPIERREPAFRRTRMVDVWIEGGAMRIEALFQDSAVDPAGGRRALHEYHVAAVADPAERTLRSITVRAGALPYPECVGATGNVQRLVGSPLADMRSTVLEMLARTAGCTHLNDVLRSLADVPRLFDDLARACSEA